MKKTITETVSADGSKKTVMKEHAPKEIEKKIPSKKRMTAREREDLLIENFIGLQHAMTNLSIKFGSLSDNITKLLQVFEEAAKNFVSGGGGGSGDKDMLRKINSLLDQNKTIAKGLVLMEDTLRSRAETKTQISPPEEPLKPKPLSKPKPLPSR